MNSNDRQPAETENQDKYEATVLDFLDREMAAAQPSQQKDQQSQELDALVSDLLKQVITEADQPQDANKLLFDEEDELFSGLTAAQKATEAVIELPESTLDELENSPSPVIPEPEAPVKQERVESSSEEKPEIHSGKPEAAPLFSLVKTRPVSLLASGLASKRNIPVAAAVFAGLVLVAAGAFYYFSGSSNESVNETEPQAAVSQPENPVVPAVPQMESRAAVSTARPQAATVKPRAVPSPGQSSTAPTKTRPDSAHQAKSKAPPAVAAPKPEPAPVETMSVQPQQVKEETPVNVQASQPVIPPATIATAVERPALAPLANNAAAIPVIPTTRPVESSASNSTPAPQPPAAVTPVPRTLVPAVPISQVTPVYPELALRTRTSATVILDMEIDAKGRVVKATPASGPSIFHNAAITAAMKWRYKPASVGGVNVPSQSRVTMVFNLNK